MKDVNEDGELDAEERQAARAARKEAREAKRASILETFDADEDGKLNEEEREAARADAKAKIEEKRVERFNEVDLSPVRFQNPTKDLRDISIQLVFDNSAGIPQERFECCRVCKKPL